MRAITTSVTAALAALLLAGCVTDEPEILRPFADHFLSDPATPAQVKAAIKAGKVIEGMCPFEAIAAAGEPDSYFVKADTDAWKPGTPPMEVVAAQCQRPDASQVELMFRNTTQFGGNVPMVFRVRFTGGRAVAIDQKAFKAN